jgi:hypothetical protein
MLAAKHGRRRVSVQVMVPANQTERVGKRTAPLDLRLALIETAKARQGDSGRGDENVAGFAI